MTEARTATLDALRRWAATNRADLLAAAWRAGNTNITELAGIIGRGRDVVYADLAARGINPKTDRLEPPTVPTADFTVLPVPGWRHPNLIELAKKKTFLGVEYRLQTKPFTGEEPEPDLPAEWSGTHPTEEHLPESWKPAAQRDEEIRIIRKEWAKAHFTYRVGLLLRDPYLSYGSKDAAHYWDQYVTARDKLEEAYTALDTTPDTMWRSALLRIIDAKQPAKDAARRWDQVAEKFAVLDDWLLRRIGEENHPGRHSALTTAAKTHGVDISGWTISYCDDYQNEYDYGNTAAAHIQNIIKEGDRRIAAVKEYVEQD